jgi:YVTN family beta-propeller protein
MARTVFITSKWAHRVMALTLDEHYERVVDSQVVKLPFAPLELLAIPSQQKLLAADAFGNRLAVLDANAVKLLAVREALGHNIRGLALSDDGKRILMAHQQMPNQALADYEELHWGRLVTNAVQVFDLKELLEGDANATAKGWMDEQGGIGSALGDPGGILTGPDGFAAVAFSGVSEVTIQGRGFKKRIPVGTFPQAMALAGEVLYVANRFDDSISVIDVAEGKAAGTISLGPKRRLTSEQRGERLFFNARLSHDGWMSCHSCHTEGHTAGLVVDTLGDGDYGAAKLTPSLLGTRDTQPWGWDGGTSLFREQIQKSITTTMHGEPLSAREMEDLAAYLGSLNAPPAVDPPDAKLIARGRAVFASQGCANCHAPPAYTTPLTADVGLLDELKRSDFNPPSLRGVGQRRRFFHDGRAESLEDVLQKIEHQLDAPLKTGELEALLVFLRSL